MESVIVQTRKQSWEHWRALIMCCPLGMDILCVRSILGRHFPTIQWSRTHYQYGKHVPPGVLSAQKALSFCTLTASLGPDTMWFNSQSKRRNTFAKPHVLKMWAVVIKTQGGQRVSDGSDIPLPLRWLHRHSHLPLLLLAVPTPLPSATTSGATATSLTSYLSVHMTTSTRLIFLTCWLQQPCFVLFSQWLPTTS